MSAENSSDDDISSAPISRVRERGIANELAERKALMLFESNLKEDELRRREKKGRKRKHASDSSSSEESSNDERTRKIKRKRKHDKKSKHKHRKRDKKKHKKSHKTEKHKSDESSEDDGVEEIKVDSLVISDKDPPKRQRGLPDHMSWMKAPGSKPIIPSDPEPTVKPEDDPPISGWIKKSRDEAAASSGQSRSRGWKDRSVAQPRNRWNSRRVGDGGASWRKISSSASNSREGISNRYDSGRGDSGNQNSGSASSSRKGWRKQDSHSSGRDEARSRKYNECNRDRYRERTRDSGRFQDRESHNDRDRIRRVSRMDRLDLVEEAESEGRSNNIAEEEPLEDANTLARKALQAKLAGNTDLYESLQEKVVRAKEREALLNGGGYDALPAVSQYSRKSVKNDSSHSYSNDKLKDSHNQKGERQSYYADDNNRTLDELVAEEKRGGGPDYDGNYARKIMRQKGGGSGRKKTLEPEFDDELVDYMAFEDKRKKNRRGSHRSTQSSTQVKVGSNSVIARGSTRACQFCFSQQQTARHRLLALGDVSFLLLPRTGLFPFHCFWVPLEHTGGGTASLESNVLEEMQKFQKSIVRMNHKAGCGTIFIETHIPSRSGNSAATGGGPHAVLECFRVDNKAAARAPMYFKKAMEEVEDEFEQQHARVIDTSRKGLSHSIPPHFPYFYVQFGLMQGLVHIIENTKSWKRQFGENILRGVLSLNKKTGSESMRKTPILSVADQKESGKSFLKEYLPCDWTVELG